MKVNVMMNGVTIWEQSICAQMCTCANFGAQMCQHMHRMCTERDDCMTMQMFVDALPRLAINSKYIDQFDCDFVQSRYDCWL